MVSCMNGAQGGTRTVLHSDSVDIVYKVSSCTSCFPELNLQLHSAPSACMLIVCQHTFQYMLSCVQLMLKYKYWEWASVGQINEYIFNNVQYSFSKGIKLVCTNWVPLVYRLKPMRTWPVPGSMCISATMYP